MMHKRIYSFAVVLVLLGILKFFTFSTTIDSSIDEPMKKYGTSTVMVPAKMEFAGENVPLRDIDTYERMDRELVSNAFFHSQTILMHKRANRWFPVITPILRRNGIPEDFKYIPLVETGFVLTTSPAGAVGFWQFMDKTAMEYGLEVNKEIDERYHVEKATEAACKYFNDAYKQLGSWTLVAAAYNMGLSGLSKQMDRQKAVNYYDLLLNAETSRYVFRILAMKELLEHPELYGYTINKKDLYPQIPTYSVLLDTAVTDFATYAYSLKINYKILKMYNPWLREAYLANADKKTYYIQIPKEGYMLVEPFEYNK